MDALELIRERRSIREYKEKMPADKDIEKILDAGRWAPSGLNNQPWKFKVIKDRKQKDKLAEFTKYGDIIVSAPVVIAVLMDTADSYNRDKDLMAIGACIQNMLLQASSVGVGTCWLGEALNRKEEIREFLRLDKDLELMALVTLGYSNEDMTESCRRSLKELIIE
ncbi:MAG: nitroreductase family protein [Candidatus Omnitrophota bacterium]|jgi:nitroreductase